MIAHNITPFDFSKNEHLWLDFTSQNTDLKHINLLNTADFSEYVFNLIRKKGKKVGVGGYLEHRAIYHRSTHFEGENEPRIVHLGVDIWADAFTPIFAPYDAIVHSFADNNNFGDYGPTIILEHIDYQRFDIPKYSLYGHLSGQSLNELFEGKEIKRGEQFTAFGSFPENGDWPPHLHFQLITDILGNTGDFPGVCSLSEKAFYNAICPTPYPMLLLKA